MSGAGIGGALGTAAGVVLAPETGGLSMAIPGALGALGGFVGGKLTGSKNPLMDAFMGGVGGTLGGASGIGGDLGVSDSAGLFGDGIAGAGEGDAALLGGAGDDLLSGDAAGAVGDAGSAAAGAGSNFEQSALANAAANGAGGAGSSTLSGIGNYLSRQNPLNLALAGGSILSGVNSLIPKKQVNVAQNAANVMATNPGFNGSLPQYTTQNTAQPYQGDWYKYGFTPQPVLYNGQPQLTMKRGGQVKGYAMGGPTVPAPMMPQGMPAQQASPLDNIPVNPLTLKAAHQAGVAVGKHLKAQGMTPPGQVQGPGGGQDDAVPAKLSQGEYVLSADIPSALGDGSTEAGAKKLDAMVSKIRAHKTSNGSKFPPKAKNPLAYLSK